MKGSRAFLPAVLALASAAVEPLEGAAKKKPPTPAATAAAEPTPAPTPARTPGPELRKAAGTCIRYEAGAYVILSEVGGPGRVFGIDSGTDVAVRARRGARLRILYVETPEGPVARKITQGPVEETKN